MSRRNMTLVAAAALTLVLGILATVLPVPYVVLVPGPVTDTLGRLDNRPVISVTGAQTYATSGHLYLTTVGVIPGDCNAHPTLWQAIRAWFDKTEAVEPHQVLCPPGQSSQAVQAENAQEMSQSQQDAVTAALLFLKYKPVTEQVIVGSVEDGTPASGVLSAGDVITAVDGTRVTSDTQLRTLITDHPIGSALQIMYSRNGKTKTVTLKTADSADGTHRPIIGIDPDLRATFKGVNVHVGVDPQQIGGPSAGLMFTLGIIDKLTPGGLTDGKTIAGTGTIDGTGTVGPIGGIQQKLAAAHRAHAAVFLAPASECGDAKSVASKSLTLVKVDTLATAVAALKAIASGSTDFPHC